MVKFVFGIVDYLIFAALLAASALIGVYFMWSSRKTATNSEIFTGNRRLPVFPVVMSLVASFMSTNTLLGVPAEIYQVGTQYSVQIITIFTAVILATEVFMPIYYRLGLTSVHEVSLASSATHLNRRNLESLNRPLYLMISVLGTEIRFESHEVCGDGGLPLLHSPIHGRRPLWPFFGPLIRHAPWHYHIDSARGTHLHLLHRHRKSILHDGVVKQRSCYEADYHLYYDLILK